MPVYQTQNPTFAIFPGDVALAFNSESLTAGETRQEFALSDYSGFPNQGRTVAWQTIYGTAPSAICISLQGAMQDVDAQYTNLDTSTATAGEQRTVSNVQVKFLRAKVTRITGGSSVTVQILA